MTAHFFTDPDTDPNHIADAEQLRERLHRHQIAVLATRGTDKLRAELAAVQEALAALPKRGFFESAPLAEEHARRSLEQRSRDLDAAIWHRMARLRSDGLAMQTFGRVAEERHGNNYAAAEADLTIIDEVERRLRRQITGPEAVECHRRAPEHTRLDKFADPLEGAREGLALEEAEKIIAEDPGLVFLTRL